MLMVLVRQPPIQVVTAHSRKCTTPNRSSTYMFSFCSSRCLVYHPACNIISDMAYQIGPFELGQIKAHVEHGLGCTAIAQRLFKADGKTCYSESAVSRAMCKLAESPGWRAGREEGSGAPRKTTKQQDRAVIRWVLQKRGQKKVTVGSIKKQFPFLRKFGDTLVEERLHEADLVYLRRRKKCLVTAEYLEKRVSYCQGVKRKHDTTLKTWAYTDGTVYYLDRSESEHANTVRRALGANVWRKSDNSDAMYQDCIGPSAYNKAQGIPVRVWGMLACGIIYIHVLDQGEVMDRTLYTELIEDKFDDWRGNCEYLVCDFEACLRTEEALHALRRIKLKLVDDYPPVSQDFNAIENVWAILKERLDQTVPVEVEDRESFIRRLKSAVLWANWHRSEQLRYLCYNQKERAADCLNMKPPGGRTKW